METGDVARVASSEELFAAICHFRQQNIEEILIQEHVKGEVIKFYGAGDTSYFSAFRESTGESITSEARQLRLIACGAAEATGLEIYGGDAIITQKCDVILIDFNDWPSFSRCREEAAASIAGHIAKSI
jgi:glutathione synthase/RimK-type ligase-like ATP-grasp enzyme